MQKFVCAAIVAHEMLFERFAQIRHCEGREKRGLLNLLIRIHTHIRILARLLVYVRLCILTRAVKGLTKVYKV